MLEEEEKKRKEREYRAEIMRPKNYEELKAAVLGRSNNLPFRFRLDEKNRTVFRLLCLYFSNDPVFEQEGFYDGGELVQRYSLKKGICLYSAVRGTGKTVMMELFSKNSKGCYVMMPTKNIASFYQASGSQVIERFSKPWETVGEPRFLFQTTVGICFDDLGDEEIKNNYGNKENVMQRVLQKIYDDDSGHEHFNRFHVTTNRSGDQLEEIYDSRVRSRMREMFNWIPLPGNDRRE